MELPRAPGEPDPPIEQETVEAAPDRRPFPWLVPLIAFPLLLGLAAGTLFMRSQDPPLLQNQIVTRMQEGCIPVAVGAGSYVDKDDATDAAETTAELYTGQYPDADLLLSRAVPIPPGSNIFHVAGPDAKWLAVVIFQRCL